MMDIRAFEAELEKVRSGFSFDTTKPCGMYVAALSRAEAAEAEAYERLEAALFAEQRATDAEMERDELAARVAELEAERAAQQWRTVTEPPEKAGDYSVMVDGWPDSIAAHYGPVLKGSGESWEWVWVDFDGEIIPVIRWQPLPAAMRPAAAGGTWRTS